MIFSCYKTINDLIVAVMWAHECELDVLPDGMHIAHACFFILDQHNKKLIQLEKNLHLKIQYIALDYSMLPFETL